MDFVQQAGQYRQAAEAAIQALFTPDGLVPNSGIPETLREPLRYALALLGLERQLAKRDDMLQVIGNRLDQIQNQVEHFGLTHDNVVAACGALYQDTLSTFRQRIQVHGDMRFLQQPAVAAKVRALLLTGIRSARLWRQLGGHRWQLVFSRGKLLKELYPLLRG